MLSILVHKNIAVFSLMVIAALIAVACSSSDDDASSGKAAAQTKQSSFQISSPNFTEIRPKKRMPQENTCYGGNLSPPLNWSGVPSETKSFALVAEDIDHHTGTPWVHWVIYNIPPSATELPEGIPTSTPELPDGSVQGLNDFKNTGYEGPCPMQAIIGYGDPAFAEGKYPGQKDSDRSAHKYVFTLYALDTVISLPSGYTKEQLIDAMDQHILGQADTVGKFQMRPTTVLKKELGRDIHRPFVSSTEAHTPTPTKR